MKMLILILLSNISIAGDFYSIQNLYGGNNPSYSTGDILYCTGVDKEHNIAKGCINLIAIQNFDFYENAAHEIIMKNLQQKTEEKIGSISSTPENFILDELSSGTLYKIENFIENRKLSANILVKKKLTPNLEIGCSGVFDCDWRLLYPKRKVYLVLKLNNDQIGKTQIQ